MPAVSIALWGAVFADHEARRTRERAWRREHVVTTLEADGVCSAALAESVWRAALQRFHLSWTEQHHTPGVAWCLGEGLAAHGLRPGTAFDELVADLETRALDDLPPLLPGAREGLQQLAERWPLGLLCDVQITPAPILRECLERHGILALFDATVFSDEVGASKPLVTGFRVLAEEGGWLLSELVHVGPDLTRDVAGAHAAGATAVRLGPATDQADACAEDLLGSIAAIEEATDATAS